MNAKSINKTSDLPVKVESTRDEKLAVRKYETSDLQLWHEFKGGSEPAFSSIYETYVDQLYRYGLKLVRDKELVKDCIQDLFIEIWDTKHKLGMVKSIRSYLFKSIRRKILSQVIRKRKLSGDIKESIAVQRSTPSSEITLIEKQRFDLEQSKLRIVLQKLNSKQREVIHLKFYGRLSYDDISEIMSLDKKAIYNLMAHTIKLLKEQLKLSSY